MILQQLISPDLANYDLKNIEYFTIENLAIVLPISEQFKYSNKKNHTHPSYLFLITYDEYTSLKIAKEHITSIAQNLYCISPDISHHEDSIVLTPRYCAIFIEKEYFEEKFCLYSEKLITFKGDSYILKNNKLNNLIKEFIFYSDETLSSQAIKNNYADLIIHHILLSIFNIKEESTIIQNSELNTITHYIDTHYHEDITLNELSKQVNLSTTHINRLFKKELNLTPINYLLKVRLKNSKRLLLSGNFTITEVALRCGFNSNAYFTKMFKRVYGDTPSEFIRSIIK